MSLNPKTFEEAKLKHKPMKRARMARKPAKKKKRKKKLTDGQLKRRAWKEFSIFIRTFSADREGFVECVTCGDTKHWKEMQAGHFIRGRLNANLFSERGVWPQCYACNVGRQGNVVVYYKFMLKTFGQAVIDELLEQNSKTRKWQAGELLALWEHYKGLNAANPLTAKE